MPTIKVLLILGGLCFTLYRMPDIVEGMQGARSGSMNQLMQLIGGAGPSAASAAPAEEDPDRLNQLLGEIGVPAIGKGTSVPTPEPARESVVITPNDTMTPEEARALMEQRREEALKRARKPEQPKPESDDQARS